MLNKLGITVGNDTKAANAFMKVFPNFFEVQYQKPSEYIKEFWEKYKKLPDTNSNLNGKVLNMFWQHFVLEKIYCQFI